MAPERFHHHSLPDRVALPPSAYALQAQLAQAHRYLERDPDAAALLLDGVLARLVASWSASLAAPGDDIAACLRAIERAEPNLSMRLRLALRAPSASARLLHCETLGASLWPHAAEEYL